MTLRIVAEPEGTLGVFDDQASTWAGRGLATDEAVELLIAAEPISRHEVQTMIWQLRGRKWPQANSQYVMSFEEAAWLAATAAGQPAGNRPLEFDGKGQRIRKHGLSGYSRGCRCDTCLARGGPSDITHGLGPTGKPSGYAQGCRCDECTAAKALYERNLRAMRAGTPQEPPEPRKYVYPVVNLSPRLDLLIRYLAGGATPGWIRAAILEKLGRDTGYQYDGDAPPAGRKTRRLPSLPDGPGSEDRTIPVSVALTLPVDALIKEQGGTRGGWIWEAILEKLERDTGYQDVARRRASRRPSRARDVIAKELDREGQQS